MLFPYFQVVGPNGENFRVEMKTDRITIGRYQEFNDIGLNPDPQKLVTRNVHCSVEHNRLGWWVVDNSVNRTFVRREKETEMVVVHARAMLQEGDCICILGKKLGDDRSVFWELTFHDPQGTTPNTSDELWEHALEYDWIQARLYRIEGRMRREISPFRPQEHKLIRYMDSRNRANGDIPVMCTYEELIKAVWGDEPQHTDSEVSHLVWTLRRKVEVDYKNPRYLKSVSGLGYRLVTRPLEGTVTS
jgi:hypothetical protein